MRSVEQLGEGWDGVELEDVGAVECFDAGKVEGFRDEEDVESAVFLSAAAVWECVESGEFGSPAAGRFGV